MNRITSDTERIRHLIQEIFMICGSASDYPGRSERSSLYAGLASSAAGAACRHRLSLYLQVSIWRKVLRRLFHYQYRLHDHTISYLHDVLAGIRVVKSFGKEEREIMKFREYNSRFAQASIRSEKVYSYLAPISRLFDPVRQLPCLDGGQLHDRQASSPLASWSSLAAIR